MTPDSPNDANNEADISTDANVLNVDEAVKQRYSEGAQTQVEALCCPVDYDQKYLEVIPQEVIDRDYGCGDPSRYLKAGETVLDLGSGTGKICFIASQVVGSEGKVIGVDMTPDMLDVARRSAPAVAEKIGYANVEFRRGRIQDLQLDLDAVDQLLEAKPVSSAESLLEIEHTTRELRRSAPLIANQSIDVVVSNCVLNLVAAQEKPALFKELHRVLRTHGRAVISDIVADEEVPEEMQADAELWSGCISGALTESGFLKAFEDAGFVGIRVLEREEEPWQTVNGIEFRSVVVEAFKPDEGPCLERNQAVIYKGPFKQVLDDDNHRIRRGERLAVCDKTFRLYQSPAYEGQFEFVEPRVNIPVEEAQPFDCSGPSVRAAQVTKGDGYNATKAPVESSCC